MFKIHCEILFFSFFIWLNCFCHYGKNRGFANGLATTLTVFPNYNDHLQFNVEYIVNCIRQVALVATDMTWCMCIPHQHIQ